MGLWGRSVDFAEPFTGLRAWVIGSSYWQRMLAKGVTWEVPRDS